MKKCPFCREKIQSEAIKCRYCGERLDGKPTTIKDSPLLPRFSRQQKVSSKKSEFLEDLKKASDEFDLSNTECWKYGFNLRKNPSEFLKDKRAEYHEAVFNVSNKYMAGLEKHQDKMDTIWTMTIEKYGHSRLRRLASISAPMLAMTKTGDPEIANIWHYYKVGILDLAKELT